MAVVIPAYQDVADVRRCLVSLDETRGVSITTIVVDNHSGPEMEEAVREAAPTAQFIPLLTNTGYAGACVRGWRAAIEGGADYVCFLNQDARVAADAIEQLVSFLDSHSTVAAVQPLILRDETPQRVNSFGNAIHILGFGYALGDGDALSSVAPDRLRVPCEVAYASGAALLVRVAALDGEDPFDPSFFMYHEDLDLGWRLRLRGWTSYIVPEARVVHRYDFHRSTSIKYEFGERNRLRVCLTNYRLGTLALLFPAWFAMEVGVVTLSMFKGWWREKLRGYVFLVQAAPMILAKRREVQRTRTVADRDVLRHFRVDVAYQEAPSTLAAFANRCLGAYWWVVRRLIRW